MFENGISYISTVAMLLMTFHLMGVLTDILWPFFYVPLMMIGVSYERKVLG